MIIPKHRLRLRKKQSFSYHDETLLDDLRQAGVRIDETWEKTIQDIALASPYLSKLIRADKDLLHAIITTDSPKTLFNEHITSLRETDYAVETAQLMSVLRQSKAEMSMITALYDIHEDWDLGEVTAALSHHAELCVELAAKHLLLEMHKREDIKLPTPENPIKGSGLVIVAMGKLGSYELNYSSDIDLIILFDPDRINTDTPEQLSSIFVNFAENLAKILEQNTEDGYVYRVDLRLRPDPGSTPLALSLPRAEIYYGSLGQNWERAAMTRARPIASDTPSANRFMELIKRWVWRRNLDFAAIQDIHSIKRQINTHKRPDGNETNLQGYNVKLGRGGIREIEFFIQTQQLIYGGRDPRLQTKRTHETLDVLLETGRISKDIRDDLADAYSYLRVLEHRLQMRNDRQTHGLPKSDERMDNLATFMGYSDTKPFLSDLKKHIENVNSHYHNLFVEAPSLSDTGNLVFTGTEPDPDTVKTLASMGFQQAERTARMISEWHFGRYRAMRSARAREILTEITPSLLKSMSERPAPDETFMRFDKFLSALPEGVPIFSMFYQNPPLMDLLIDVLGLSPLMAQHLTQKPKSLEGFLTKDFYGRLPDRETLRSELEMQMAPAQNYEDVLEITRRWALDKRFFASIHILKNITDPAECGKFLAQVAEAAITSLAPHIEADFVSRYGRFRDGGLNILGYGRLGIRQMTLRSDLDLVFVYSPPSDPDSKSDGDKALSAPDYYARLAQRYVTALSVRTSEGILYDVDTRLRPHGKSGALAISIAGFEKYYLSDAWVWEQMALTRARIIHGIADDEGAIHDMLNNILTQSRNKDTLRTEIIDMRRRIAKEHGRDNPWDLKNRVGGLTDINFIIQYLILKHSHQYPEILDGSAYQKMRTMEKHGIITTAQKEHLEVALATARRMQNILRLIYERAAQFNPEKDPPRIISTILSCMQKWDPFTQGLGDDIDFDLFQTQLDNIMQKAFQHCLEIIGKEFGDG